MTKSIRWGMGASAIMMAVAFAAPTNAQQPAPQKQTQAPAPTQAPAVQGKPATPAPKVIQAQKPGTPPGSGSGSGSGPGKDTKAPKKAKSNCNTQYKDEKSCVADTTCVWVAAKVDAKTGKEQRKAYCRVKPTPPPAKKGPTPPPKKGATPVVPPKATVPPPPPPGPAPAPKAPPAPTK